MVDFYKKAKMAFLLATEPSRVVIEAVQLHKAMPELLAKAPRGNGQPVMVIPGFGATDFFTKALRKFLDKLGYKTYGWENGANARLTEKKIKKVYKHLEEISEENGGQKVILIGWSLGGIVARVMAHESPKIRAVITLGSPFGISEHPDASPKLLVDTIQRLNEEKYTLNAPGMKERILTPAEGVPTISIYSKTDGISGWLASRNPKAPLVQDIEIEGSHCGLVINAEGYSVLADILPHPEKIYDPQHRKPPKNPKFELTDENTFLKDIPVASRKNSTSPNNSDRRRPGAPPS